MANDQKFNNLYSLNLAQLSLGKEEESFELNRSFFEHFDFGLSQNGQVQATLQLHRYEHHIDVMYFLKGTVEVACDRCLEPYLQPIDSSHRLIYSFDPDQKFEDTEVIQVKDDLAPLLVAQELYDFTQVSLPLRRVPEPEVHLCDPKILEVLGIDADGNRIETQKEDGEDEIDPRWAALKKLKNKDND